MKLSRGHSFHTRMEAHQQPLSFTDPHIEKGEDNCWTYSKLPSGQNSLFSRSYNWPLKHAKEGQHVQSRSDIYELGPL